MFDVLNTLGAVMRSAVALGFAAMWGWFSVLLNGWGTIGTAAMGLAVMALIVTLGGFAIIIGFYCLLRLSRELNGDKKSAEPRQTPAIFKRATVEPEFDAEAIIARHLAARAAQRQAVLSAPDRARRASAAGFGRRGLANC